MKNPKFQVYKSQEEFRYRLQAKNGEPILHSEGYTTKAACLNGVESVKTNGGDDSKYSKEEKQGGKCCFSLKAGNGEVIGVSEMYNSTSARDNGIEAVKRVAAEAPVEDIA